MKMKNTKQLWIFTAVILLINIVIYLTHWGGDQILKYVSDGLPIICALIATISIYKAFREFKEFDFTKTAWLMILIGIALFMFAETTYSILEIFFKLNMDENFPSVADIFWCTGYIPLFIGLSMMFFGYLRSGLPMGNLKLYLLLSILLLIVLGLVITFILIPIIKDPETGLLTKIFSLFYPIADTLIVIPAVILMYITSLFGTGIISKPWKYLALGFICFTIADLLYSYLSWQEAYGNGNLIDIFWHVGYLLIAFAGINQKNIVKSFE
jgi:hypothetical protein